MLHPAPMEELMEVNEKYGDLATWEIKSLSVGGSRTMLGVVTTCLWPGRIRIDDMQ